MASTERTITVVGAGFMGTVLATLYAHHGYNVRLSDTNGQALDTYRNRARPIAASFTASEAGIDDVLARVSVEADLEKAVHGSFFVHEVIHENLAAKQSLFGTLDRICGAEVVLGTNTSSFSLSDICKSVATRERVLGVHYITPAHVIDLVEIVAASFTPRALIQWGLDFLTTIKHVGIVCTDTPGFVVNRLQYALLSEAYRIVSEGAASRDDVDKAFRLSLGPRLALWGPLLTEDLVVSKKTTAPIWDYLHDKTRREVFHRPPATTDFVNSGKLGAISGEGWYRFDQDYPSVVVTRDAQLKEMLEWLRVNDAASRFKIR